MQSKLMQYAAKKQIMIKTHLQVTKIVDGDGLIVKEIFTNTEFEIRLAGIDAPEIPKCKKLLADEKQLQMPGELLRELGARSKNFLSALLPIGTNITAIIDRKNQYDIFGRTLALVLTNEQQCINEILLEQGFAKPYPSNVWDESWYRKNLLAKANKEGLYGLVNQF